MEKDLKTKIKILETQKMAAQVDADKQEKIYKNYARLPLYLFLLIVSIFLAWGISDAWANQGVEIRDGAEVPVYGIWRLENSFHVYMSWALIGAFIGAFVYLITKVIVSAKIITIEYLKIFAINNQLEEKKQLVKKLPPNPDN